MKRIDTSHSWNWVDENNYMVGFESDSQCCESYGYMWVNDKGQELPFELDDHPDFYFTGQYDSLPESMEGMRSYQDFEVTNGTEIYYLIIYNDHNGYYAHGFNFSEGETSISGGYL